MKQLTMVDDAQYGATLDEVKAFKEVKDGLAQIFSDSLNKPYIHEVLKEIDPEREVYSKEKVMQLNIIR